MQLNNKILQDPLKEKTLPEFAIKLGINHYSSTQFSIPDAAWLFKYIYCTQEQRREAFESNSAMEAGKRVGEALQRVYAETIYKINPLTKKVAPTQNEKLSMENAVQEQIEIFKDYVPVNEKDSDKKIKYLEEVPEVIKNADAGLKELGVASPVTCERQISIDADKLEGNLQIVTSLLPVVGRIDFDFGNQNELGENPTEAFSSSLASAFPHKIIELKTKYSRLGKVKKDGSRSFLVSSPPATPSFNHLVQCAVYAANWNFKIPVYLIYATATGYQIFDSTNCKHLTQEGLIKNLQIMMRTFIRREKILSQYQELTKEEIIENAVDMMDMNADHPYAWNGLTPELLQEAKDLWKVS